MSEKDHVARIVPQNPDESLFDALGNQHSMETAIADLVDNSIEYGGTQITIQLITNASKLERIRIVDNGRGMKPQALEESMQLRKKTYDQGSLSFFGMGMKMASLSQAALMRVFTQSEDGANSGAQMRRKDAGGLFNTEILEDSFSKVEYSSFRRSLPGSGTIVEWQRIDDVSIDKSQKERNKWLNKKVRAIQLHCGLVFHRFLEKGSIRIFVEIWDSQTQQVGGRTPASPIDPFAFRSPMLGYPAAFYGKTRSKVRVDLFCAMVPPGSESDSVRIHGLPLDQLGGFYVYRNDRLIQIAGWQELTHKKSKDLQHCRIRIELTNNLIDAGMKLTAEKTSVKLSDEIKQAILSSKSEQLDKTFEDYLADGEKVKKNGAKRNTGLQPSLRITGAENSVLRNSVEQLIGFKNGSDHLEIISVPLNEDQVFELDLENDELRINSLLFEEDGPLDSETAYEFFKATLYFLLEHHFTKTTLNRTTLQKIEQMHRVLAVALGIQTLDSEVGEKFVAPSPAVIASMPRIQVPAKPLLSSNEENRIYFQPVWSSVTSPKSPSAEAKLKAVSASDSLNENVIPETSLDGEVEESWKVSPYGVFERDPNLAKLGLDALKEYKKTHDVASVSSVLRKSEEEITALLARLLLDFTGSLDNREEAFLADEPFTSSERDRLMTKFRDGQDILRLSMETGRTVLQIAREILDSPSFQAKVPSTIIKKLGQLSS